MTESVLASLDAPSNEADSAAGSQPVESAGAPDVGASTPAAGNGERDAAVSAPAPGEGTGGDHRNPNGAEGGKPQLVPLSALHESREKIRALTAQIDELKKQPQLSTEDAELLKELKAQRKAASEPKDPEFLEDPKGYIDAKEKRISDALKQLKEGETKRTEAEQQQQQVQQIVTATLAKETEFVKTTPDYSDALAHLRNVRTQQLKMLFPQATEQQIHQQIGREELAAAAQVLQAGGDPAKFAYDYSKTMGYVKKVAPMPQTNGIAAAAAAATASEPTPDKDAVRTLGGGGGAEGDNAPEDPMPEFSAALRERFTRKRK